jgi:hypothetical protein
MKPDKSKVLNDLLNLKRPLLEIQEDLAQLNWDSNDKVCVLDGRKLENILNAYINNNVSNQDLELWANMVECREDIQIDERQKNLIKHIIFAMANPYLEGEINKPSAENFLRQLRGE